MNLKNEFKDFGPIGIIGIIEFFILSFYVDENDLIVSLFVAFSAGIIFMVTAFALGERRAKKADKVFNELCKYKNILCRGLVVSNRKGAWMFLTENTLEIYFDKIDINGKKAVIALKDITNVTYKGNKTLNISISGKTYKFSVCDAILWEKMIKEQVSNNKANASAEAQTQSDSPHTEKARFCGNCGKKLDENTAFCPNCGGSTGNQNAYRTYMYDFTDNTDKKIVIIKLLSVAAVLSTLFFDIFRTVVSKSGTDEYDEIIFYVFKSISRKSGYTTVYNSYEYIFPGINIAFIILLIMSILIFAFTHFRKYNFVIACSILNILFLAAGFVIYAYLMHQAFNSPKFTFENGISFIFLPGIGWAVNFILTLIIMFFAISALPNKKKLKA